MSKYNFSAILSAVAALICLTFTAATAQTPYSQYGYGTLDDNATGTQRAIGGAGIGMRNNLQINVMNPASYTSIDSLTFMFDFSADYKASWYEENGTSTEGQGGGLNYILMQFPLGKRVAACAGLTPLTHVQYTYGNYISNGSYTRIGEGGISQAFAGVAYEPWDWVSLGVNFGYIFGDIQNAVEVNPENADAGTYYKILTVSDFRFQAGLQLMHTFAKKHDVTLGFVYTLGKPVLGTAAAFATNSDTTNLNMKGYYSMPHGFGTGISYVYDKRLTAAVDVRYDLWERAKFFNPNTDSYEQMSNRLKIAAGLEFRPKLLSTSYFDYIRYRIGGYYEQSYIMVGGNHVNEYGISCGFGFPFRSDKSMLNIGLEYSHRNGSPNKLLNEDHLSVIVSITFNEMWFWQRKL